jgi:hypothetical protein
VGLKIERNSSIDGKVTAVAKLEMIVCTRSYQKTNSKKLSNTLKN